ncbi:unnamed protein product [Phyllotreta striolata]|uniref:Laminin EGF-like domain-containing protein n=1 Tax=Phyllotreta striolata TaxID=444603 RepID=A0A9N9TCZ9_PHYSR|nr:unnamed protein product [Phyllotreta striolata]
MNENCWLSCIVLLLSARFCEFNETFAVGGKASRCYDEFNRPQRCIPEFENAAFDILIESSNTCGDDEPSEYCSQTGAGVGGAGRLCEMCYTNEHHSRYMTDFHSQDYPTWWQSKTMFEGVQYPNQVNLTLKFGKAFDITYIRIWFWSPRPESFHISKKTSHDGPWIPYQYYSSTCRDTYGLPESTHTLRGDETRALCTSEYSDISPLKGGNVAFGTLEGRPSAYNFDESSELQEWVTATEIMITLDRLNTFGDEVFGDQKVLKSYFYAIADVAVGARCKCNGHASECSAGSPGSARACKCEHNTDGPDCERCLPFYNDAPWGRAGVKSAHECKECNCNGFSNRCYFDQSLYEQTGHGGHCLDCSANRDGPNCESCRENYFMRADGYCFPCDCDRTGSRHLQCSADGKCECKPGVTGDKCDKCQANFYEFSSFGCKNCGCHTAGSIQNRPSCDPFTGNCYCKENVEGKRCRECKPGYFNLQENNPFGCTPCFCYGHSSSCKSAPGYSKYSIESSFTRSDERWSSEDVFGNPATVNYDPVAQSISVRSEGEEIVYFVAPGRFQGDQRASYGQLLEFVLRLEDNRPAPSPTDIIVEGNGASITNTIFSQENKLPSTESQKFSFRLHEHPDYGWQPRLSSTNFISILTNVTAIKIKGTYSPFGSSYLDEVKLETALRGIAGEPSHWIESCECPSGYVGQFCESCAPGFRHSLAFNDPFLPCIPCDCNNHATICDSDTGKCICQHNTEGENCQYCAKGYYGNALKGTANDCLPCRCPNGGPCMQIDEETITCTDCPAGYTGHRCEFCSDGYFGDPSGLLGTPIPCRQCDCNRNIDPNAIGNCNTTTGECLKCIFNTAGPKCEHCLSGFYGNALALPKGDCRRCECNSLGTEKDIDGEEKCDRALGVCECKIHVVGSNCDRCEDGYFDLSGDGGCRSCDCDTVGAWNRTCDVSTGQCFCRPGVEGLRCDRCESRKYGFSLDGCKECNCDPDGSQTLQCDNSGRCPCYENVEGERCDRCKDNKYDRRKGCVDCPDCYKLVEIEMNNHNSKLDVLKNVFEEIENAPTVISDEEFSANLHQTQKEITYLYTNASLTMGNKGILGKIKSIKEASTKIERNLNNINENIYNINTNNILATTSIQHADELLDEIKEKQQEINNDVLNEAIKSLNNAQTRADLAGEHSEKMTKISHEARDIANNLETQSSHIVNISKQAKLHSTEAYNTARNSVAEQTKLIVLIKKLQNDIKETSKQLHSTNEWMRHVKQKTEIIKKNALTLFTEAENLNIPKTDILEYKQKSAELQQKAILLREKSNNLFEESKHLKENVFKQLQYGNELTQKAANQYDELMDYRNDLTLYESQANGVVKLWNEIWNNAESNYQLLREFDSQTKKRKKEADAALQTVTDIRTRIDESADKVLEYREHLDQASVNAELALRKAQQANALANNASIKADNIKHESELLYKNSTALVEEAGLMFDRVQNTDGELKSLVENTKSNTSLVNEAKEKVGRAERDTEEVSNKVHKLLYDIENIVYELEHSPTIDESDVDRLEEQIKITEEKIHRAKLDERLQELIDERKLQEDLIDKYRKQIAIMQGEVDNIEQIVDRLPSGCYRRLELEP